MKKKLFGILLTGVLCIGMLVGCGLEDPPAEKQIVEDVNAFGIDVLEEDGVVITDCEIIKRQTNEEEKEDIAYCRLTSKEGYCRAEYEFKLTYNYYDEGGWVLDVVEPENEDTWVKTYVDEDGNDVMDSVAWMETDCEAAEFQGMYLPIIVDSDAYGYGFADPATGEITVEPWEVNWKDIGYFSKNANSDGYVTYVESYEGAYLINEKGEQISDTYETMADAGYIEQADGTWIYLYAGSIGSDVYVMNGDGKVYCTVPGQTDVDDVYFNGADFASYTIENENGNRYEGLFDLKGNIIIPAKYEVVFYSKQADCIIVATDWDNGAGAVDKKGNIILPLEYSYTEACAKVGHDFDINYPQEVKKVADAAGMDLNGAYKKAGRYLMTKEVYKEDYGIEIDVWSLVDEKGNILIDQFEGDLSFADAFGDSVRAVTWDAETIFYFDLDGIQRTPKLQYVCDEYEKRDALEGMMPSAHDLFEYKGRQGVFTD